MKIIDVKSYPLRTRLEQPFAFSQGWVTYRSATIVEVVTDEGMSGWGEALCMGLQPPEVAASVVDFALKPLLLGADPSDLEPLWHRMYNHTRDYGMKGAVVGGISAVDIALWDIAGKTLGVPVCKLLGGTFRSRVEAYATGFYRTVGQGEAERLAKEAENHAMSGFKTMKIKVGFGLEDDIAVVRAVRGAVGEGITLMIDANHGYGVNDAIRLGRALEGVGLRWFEEPVAPEDVAGYRTVRDALGVAVAGGEGEYTLFGFRDLISRGAVDIAQPDLCHVGGFTAGKHILALAHAFGVQVNPHVWGSAIGQAASLQFVASVPISNPSLYAKEPIFEYDCSAHPFRSQLVKNPLQQKDGFIDVPMDPGLGVDVDRTVLERYRV